MVGSAVKKADVRMVVQRYEVCQSIDTALVQWKKRKLEYYPCLKQAGDKRYACLQPALFVSYQLWSLSLHHLVTPESTGHCQHNTPIGVHLLQLGLTCRNINRHRYGVFFRVILAVPEKVGCTASVSVSLRAGRKRHSREEPPVYKSNCCQQAMFDPRIGVLI